MLKNVLIIFIYCLLICQMQAQVQNTWNAINNPLPTKIAFGSCGNQDKAQPILSLVKKYKPDLWIYLGDNIYGDTTDVKTIEAKYNKLGSKTEFKQLNKTTPIIGTWDDHDYGLNDYGKWLPFKEQSKNIFLDFFGEAENSPRRQHAGIYTSYYAQKGTKILQIILLDLRSFKSNALPCQGCAIDTASFFYERDYLPHTSEDSNLLGEEQWQWLEKELRKPASLRIIGSSSQFGISYNGYEGWCNYPHEQKRLAYLIERTKANGILFISGDVHYGEISKWQHPITYPIYDITSSGITSTWKFATPNTNRIEGPIMENHFGLLKINWKEPAPIVTAQLIDVNNNIRAEYIIDGKELFIKQ
jgi:alkaline phosphatase D